MIAAATGSSALYRTWLGKLAKRDAQLIVISTAGEVGGEFEDERKRMRQAAVDVSHGQCFTRAVRSGAVLHEWAVPEDGDVDDLELVKAANPFSGVTLEYLREKRELPGMTTGHWSRFTCNLASRSEQAAIQEREWHAARATDEIPAGQEVWVGLDVAWKWDTTALVPLWWRDDEYRLFGPATVLVPPRDGSSLHPSLVEQALRDIHERTPIHTVVMDPSKAEQLAVWISDELGCTVIERLQTNKYACEDYERVMEALREGWLRHAGDAGLTSHALNSIARVLPQGDARFDRPSQTRAGSKQDVRVIDALTAAAMVHSAAAVAEVPAPVMFGWG
jgi:phage terminase large subunit-like protein